MTEELPYLRLVVDRREGRMILLVDDAGGIVELSARKLQRDLRREGAVLRVPVGKDGKPVWARAVRDLRAERQITSESRKRLERLRRSDPGGDVEL